MGTHITSGSARRSISKSEYGVSAFGVTTAVSLGVKVLESFQIWLKGALYCEFALSIVIVIALAAIMGKP